MSKAKAAAYLLTKQLRADAKTRGVKRCTAGNKRCGGRCIPIEWDCRLRGEGGDSHLKAAGRGSDPLAALANLQRGATRIQRGITKGNFSEVEGGRKAVIRGVVKGSPKDLKEKKELQAKLVNATIGVGIVGAVLAGGVRAHTILSGSPLYRNGPGRRLEDGLRNVWNDTLDTVNPIRRQRAEAAKAAVGGTLSRARGFSENNVNRIFESSDLSERFLRTPPASGAGVTGTASRAVTRVRPGDFDNVADWHQASLKAFWRTPRTSEQVRLLGRDAKETGYYFSTIASEKLLRQQYEIPGKLTGSDLIASIGNKLNSQHRELLDFAADRGLDMRSVQARRAFADQLVASTNTPKYVRNRAVDEVSQLLNPSFNGDNYARYQYRQLNLGYDSLITSLTNEITLPIYKPQGGRIARSSLITAAAEGHAEYLAQRLYNVSGTRIVRGPATADLVINHYYVKLAGRTAPGAVTMPWNAPAGLLARAAREYTGEAVSSPAAAVNILQREGAFKGLQYHSPVDDDLLISRVRPGSAGRSARRSTFKFASQEERQTYLDLAKQFIDSGRYKDYQKALAAARREIIKRRANAKRGDAATQRLDKKCGKSGIAPEKKCTKPTSAGPTVAEQRKREAASNKLKTKSPESALSKVGKVAAVAGGIAAAGVGGRAAVRNRRNIKAYTEFTPKVLNKAITRLSQKDIAQRIEAMPVQWREPAKNLLGKAKAAAAYMSADAQGFDLVNVDNESNFSTWVNAKAGRTTTIGSVGDSLVMFNATKTGRAALRTEAGEGVDIIDLDFQIDLGFQQKQGVDRESGMKTVKMIKSMYNSTLKQAPKNALLRNVPYGKDAKGSRRASLYKRAGFKELRGVRGNSQWALYNNGKVEAIPDQYEELFADVIKGMSYSEALNKWQRRNAA